jgi:hypothetical protein
MWGQCYKNFYIRNLHIFVISECLSQTGLSSLVQCLWSRPGAYPRVEHLKVTLLGQTPALPTKIRLGWSYQG